jgi:hypothetical protein
MSLRGEPDDSPADVAISSAGFYVTCEIASPADFVGMDSQ